VQRASRATPFRLTPASIIAAAEADLKLRAAQRGEAVEAGVRVKPYCFHRAHGRRASCALDLIDRAIAGRYDGIHGGKRITALIYADEGLLAAARALLSPLGGAA
jgi:hypothetical protein